MKTHLPMAACMLLFSASALSQTSGSIAGIIQDSTGAVIPGASITLKSDSLTRTENTAADGHYQFGSMPGGTYSLSVEMSGFASLSRQDIPLRNGKAAVMNLVLTVAETQQQLTVTPEDQQVSTDADQNASARIIKGKDLDSLDDNPDALRSELSALAGPAAGANGGQLYIDGFSGGQLPQKSAIKEVRINQNPLSAEFDRLGYGRIEIFTKPGAEKLSASVGASYLNSSLDTANPLVTQQPSYQFFWVRGDITGPIKKNWSYTLNAFEFRRQSIRLRC